MEEFSGIYKITNIVNGKVYIGSSKNLLLRERKHFNDLGKGVHHSANLQYDYKKYGAINFKFEIIELVEIGNLFEVEQRYLDDLKPYLINIGYNVSEKAKSCVLRGEKHWAFNLPKGQHHWYGRKHTPETKAKISKAQMGELNHQYGKPSPMRGKHISEESKKKISESCKGRPCYWKGKKMPVTAVEKMRQAAIGRAVSEKVKHKSKEWGQNISKGKKGKNMGKDNPNSLKVIQLDANFAMLREFDAISQASRETHTNINSIVANCKGRRKSAGGYRWMYYEEYKKLTSERASVLFN